MPPPRIPWIYNLGNGPTRLNDFIRLVEEHSGESVGECDARQLGRRSRTCADINKAEKSCSAMIPRHLLVKASPSSCQVVQRGGRRA